MSTLDVREHPENSMVQRSQSRSVRKITLPAAPDFSADALARLSPSRKAVLDAPAYVVAHHAEKFAASAIARHCGLSRFQFSRSFHSVFSITFREYLLRYRILEACRRLKTGGTPVTEIAYAVGFHDGSYFARMFRRYTGVLPSQYARVDASTADA
jgi:AraC-like DNA-binding protein